MKKVVSLALSALLALSLAACSSSNTTSTAVSSAASDAASSEESTSDSSTSTASSAADNATAEPDIQFDESFQPQTIADNDTCTIILQNVGYDDSYGYYWTVDFQNKTDDKTLCAITSSSSLNGIPADTSWFPEIGPGVKTTEVVSWDKAGLEIYGVKPQDIDTVKLHIDVYDEAEWDVSNRDDPVDDDFVIYPKGEEKATEPKHEIDWNIRKGIGVPNDDWLILSRNANNVVHNVKFLRLEVFASLHQHIDYRVQDRIITFHNSVNG